MSRHKMARQLWKTAVEGINTGSDLFETWIPDGGFEIQRRKTNDGMADCLVPKWGQAEAFPSRPCQEQPCLHRLLAECPHDRIADFAGSYGLLSFSIPRHLAARKLHAAEVFMPEPVAFWHEQIRLLRSAADLWDAIAAQDVAVLRRLLRQPEHAKRADLLPHGRDLLARKIADRMAGARFDLIPSPDGDHHFAIGYRPLQLIDALWQRLAEEIAGMITCSKCPAPQCGRWFLRSAGRHDRQFCSHPCQMRVWRQRTFRGG